MKSGVLGLEGLHGRSNDEELFWVFTKFFNQVGHKNILIKRQFLFIYLILWEPMCKKLPGSSFQRAINKI